MESCLLVSGHPYTPERDRGITPKSLRGSGASWLFRGAEDVSRGRWQSKRTLGHYLQDVLGQVLLADLIQDKRDFCLDLADSATSLLAVAKGSASADPR